MFGVFAVSLLAAVAAAFLPDDPYQRFHQLDHTEYRNLRWIYERLHFDPAPIDVAFLGASRTASGVDTAQVAAALACRGAPATLLNFAIPLNGRNLDWVLTRQLFETKTPKLIVIGVIEQPGRYGHEVYKYVASRSEMAAPSPLSNVNYPRDLIYLPYRQLKLSAARLFPKQFGLNANFTGEGLRSRATEPGYLRGPDGRWRQIYGQNPLAVLYSGVARSKRITTKPVFPKSLAWLEFGPEYYYISEIAALAKVRGARIAFLFIPQFKSDGNIQAAAFYRTYGTLLDASFLSADPSNYSSFGHLNEAGSARLSAWLATAIVPLLPPASQHSRVSSICEDHRR